MRYIALEEAFFIPELAERQPTAKYQQLVKRMRPEWAQRCQLRLPDFGDHRLAEMDDAGIDIQVLSLTSPGLQIDIGAEQAREEAARVTKPLPFDQLQAGERQIADGQPAHPSAS